MILTAYLVSLESYKTPYMAPYAPGVQSDKKDGFIMLKSLRYLVLVGALTGYAIYKHKNNA